MIPFNIDELLRVAEQIERNGGRFYRDAAEKAGDEASRKVLLALAAMEDAHLDTFSLMRKELGEKEKQPGTFDPMDEALHYIKAFAAGHIFDLTKDPCEVLKTCGDMVAILRAAIDLEKDSVVFYTGMKDAVPERLGRDKVDEIIAEEVKHMAMISDQLDEVLKH